MDSDREMNIEEPGAFLDYSEATRNLLRMLDVAEAIWTRLQKESPEKLTDVITSGDLEGRGRYPDGEEVIADQWE